MRAEFWLADKYGPMMSRGEVLDAMKVAPQTLSNLISRSEFPKALPGGSWATADVGEWIDRRRKAA